MARLVDYNHQQVRSLLKFIRHIHKNQLEPRDFITKYGVTQAQLAELLGVSLPLVKSWFLKEEPRQPEQRYLDRLSEIDALLEIKQKIDEKIPEHLRRLFYPD